MRGEDHVLIGAVGARDGGDRIEDRHLAQVLRFGRDPEHRALPVLRETEDEAVVLAAQHGGGHGGRLAVEDPEDAPPRGPVAGQHALGASRLERQLQPLVVESGPLEARRPGRTVFGAGLDHPVELVRQRRFLVTGVGTAGELRRTDQHVGALHRAEDGSESRRIGGIGENHDGTIHRLALGAGAPGKDHPLQRTHPRRDEIKMAGAALPSLPGAVLHVLGADAPARIGLDQPVVPGLDAW